MPKHARVIGDEEFEVLLRHVAGMRYGARNKLIVFLTHKAGMRVGEVASLKHSDVLIPAEVEPPLDNGRAVFSCTVCIHNVQYNISPVIQLRKREVKAEYSRTVHLSSTVQSALQEYYNSVQTLDDCYLCINRLGNKMNNVALAQEVRRWYLDTGLNGCSSHTGRRGYVTTLLSKQVSVKVVQELVGHRHLSSTQRYAETMDTMLKDAVEQL